MFSPSPPKGPSGHQSTTRDPQPVTPSRLGAHISQLNPSEQTLSTATQHTPSRANQLAQASSPNTPFGISSDSGSSESEFCEIQHVQPSPNRKRKLPAADERVQPSKKAKTQQTPPESSASANKNPTPQATSGPSRAPDQASSSAAAPNRSSSVSSKTKPAVQSKFLPQSDNSSDCFIEKVLPLPKRRQQTQPQPSKRRRIDRAGNASVLVGDANIQSGQNGHEDSECEIVHTKPSPNRLSLTMLTSTDSDADDERPVNAGPQVPRKIAAPRKSRALPLKPADNCPTMKEPTATPSPVSSQVDQSIVVDLSQLVTSDSDSSAVETLHSTAQVTQPLPAQGEPTAQSNQPGQSATDHSTATELAPSPEDGSQSQHQSDPESDDITATLMDFLDSQLEEMKKDKKKTSPSSDDNEPFSTIPEHPHHELVRPKVEPQEDSCPIKKEIESGTESYDDDNDDNDDGDSPTLIKMEDTAGSDSSELLMSSPPISYQLPPTEEDSPKPVKREPDTEPEDESSTEDFNGEKLSASVSSFNERLAASYKLQPVYSGEKLSKANEPGTPGSFRPHHRDSLIGLKSILKKPKTSPARASGNDTKYSSSPNVSPPLRSRRVSSSPTERVQGSKKQAKAFRPSTRMVS
ncbi:hypothetical protein N0V84_004145 [Fusarium piperis]|uniref:Uncharacterized protein n=1 Tax=Fusarium piperis TaxID=1435070 RepID=A0A9W9BQH5_9HYPO|nr:hypothetical protein N0V84_004145 [Fusarium piperis]